MSQVDRDLEAQIINESIDYLQNRFELLLNFDDITPWSHVMVAAEDRADSLRESSDIILIRRDADGNWPKKVRQTVASAIGQAASTERRGELTPEVFVAIQTRLLNELAALAESLKGEE